MVKLTEALVLARSRASDLENVRKLNCWGSEISDVSILRKMPNVHVVSLSVNKIESLEDFGYCSNLEELYIRKNNINELSEICHLKKLTKLRVLWLADNPCSTGDQYRMTVLKHLPNIQKLDNTVVEEEEVNDAIEKGSDLSLPESISIPSSESKESAIEVVTEMNGNESGDKPAVQNSIPEENVTVPVPVVSASVDILEGNRRDSENRYPNPVAMSWEETNKIRSQLGLKPLAVEKVTQMKPRSNHSAKSRNANLLQAVLHLVKELDGESLEIVADAVRNRLDAL